MLDVHALKRPVKTASVWQVRQPLYTGSKARWRHYQQHLEPLIAVANRAISSESIEMVTLPERAGPGFGSIRNDTVADPDPLVAVVAVIQLESLLAVHAQPAVVTTPPIAVPPSLGNDRGATVTTNAHGPA